MLPRLIILTIAFFLHYQLQAKRVVSVIETNEVSNLIKYDTYKKCLNDAIEKDAVSLHFTNIDTTQKATDWKLTVKALHNSFSNGNAQFPIHLASLKYNNKDEKQPLRTIRTKSIQLSIEEQIVFQNAFFDMNSLINGKISFDLNIEGGDQVLLAPLGIYNLDLQFQLYNASNHLVSTYTAQNLSFQKTYDPSNLFSIQIQNKGNLITFDSTHQLDEGVSLNKPLSLKVSGKQSYQILANTISENFISKSNSWQIPVSIVTVEASLDKPVSGIYTHSLPLSASSNKPLIVSKENQLKSTEYNLRYTIKENESVIINAPNDDYQGILMITAVPL